ncbi:MAG TPA: tetratricopeptide repeat protein [Gemmatimonadaceae bacterium]|jgi:tetratricopeptide (TPR) repeat protein|nr:tetratricopeptide repeat protein [Gemmatimonadaceae bacterium]
MTEIATAPEVSAPGNPDADLAALENKGWSHLEATDLDAAAAAFDKALAIDPTSEGALQGRVAAYRKKRQFAPADQLLRTALNLHPNSIGLLSERGWIDFEQNEYAKAVDAFSKILELVPDSEDKIVWKSSLLRALRRFDDAEATLQHAETLLPSSPRILTERAWLAFDQQEYDRALEMFNTVLDRRIDDELAQQGRIAVYRMKGNYGEASRLLEEALEDHPKSAGLRSEEGWVNYEQAKYEQAEQAFAKVVVLQPNDAYTKINLAWSLVRQGRDSDLEEAVQLCRTALRLKPDLADAYGCLGVIAAKQGRLREAESNLIRSIRLDKIRGRRSDLGALYIQMGRHTDAEKVLTEAVTVNHNDGHAHVELGNLYLLTDRLKKAVRQLQIARSVDPTNADPPRALAIALLETGKVVEAEKVLREALRALDGSKRWQLHLTLCQVLTRVGDETGEATFYRDALQEANEAIRMKDTEAEPYFFTGIVRYKLGDYSGSLKDFRRCTSKNERHLEADLNARRIEALLRSDLRSRVGRRESYGLAGIFLLQILLIWIVFLNSTKISQGTMIAIVPLLLGLMLVSILLPWLSRLKLQGLEAVLSEPKPKETLASGPKGEVGFDTALATMVGR